jgi:hypothetical protein
VRERVHRLIEVTSKSEVSEGARKRGHTLIEVLEVTVKSEVGEDGRERTEYRCAYVVQGEVSGRGWKNNQRICLYNAMRCPKEFVSGSLREFPLKICRCIF